MTMAAPTQAQRDLKAPLSRSQRSSNLSIIFVALGVLALVAVGAFLFFMAAHGSVAAPPNNANNVMTDSHKDVDWNAKEKIVKEENAAANVANAAVNVNKKDDTLVIQTKHGDIRIVLRPDLSPESVAHVIALAESGKCKRCNLYRAEKPGILQGIMQDPGVALEVTTKGKCPPAFEGKKQNCPAHDPNCGCHGPIMTKGMVGWAGGDTGPDFFIDNYKQPAKFWGNQHTVFGEIKDEDSFALIDRIWTFPATNRGGMTYLDDKIHFTLSLQ